MRFATHLTQLHALAIHHKLDPDIYMDTPVNLHITHVAIVLYRYEGGEALWFSGQQLRSYVRGMPSCSLWPHAMLDPLHGKLLGREDGARIPVILGVNTCAAIISQSWTSTFKHREDMAAGACNRLFAGVRDPDPVLTHTILAGVWGSQVIASGASWVV